MWRGIDLASQRWDAMRCDPMREKERARERWRRKGEEERRGGEVRRSEAKRDDGRNEVSKGGKGIP